MVGPLKLVARTAILGGWTTIALAPRVGAQCSNSRRDPVIKVGMEALGTSTGLASISAVTGNCHTRSIQDSVDEISFVGQNDMQRVCYKSDKVM